MKLKRWQLIWTLLNVLWLGAFAFPMLLIHLREDSYQLEVYFGTWVSMVLFPTLAVYASGLVFGLLVAPAVRDFRRLRPASWKAHWLLASIGWAVLSGLYVLAAGGPLNPFHHFSGPLAIAIFLLMLLVPPVVLYAAGLCFFRFRRGE